MIIFSNLLLDIPVNIAIDCEKLSLCFIKIVEKSKYKINIIKSLYQGKDYKVKATHNLNEFHFYSKDSYEPKTTLYFDFDSKNLIFFNKKCESYFT